MKFNTYLIIIVTIFILLWVIVTHTGCSSNVKIPEVKSVTITLPPAPPDYSNDIKSMKEAIGALPTPKTFVVNNITYYGFTKEQLSQLRILNESFSQLEKIIESQKQQADVYFLELQKVKELAELNNEQAKIYRDLVVAANQRAQDKVKFFRRMGYAVIGVGAVLAVVLVAM